MGFFKHNEGETVRVPKLNSLELRVTILESGGGSSGYLDFDGGDANGVTGSMVVLDGGGASG